MSSRTPETAQGFETERPLTAQRLAQYVARGRCERHLRFALFPSEAKALTARYGVELEPLSPLLSKAGQDYEGAQVEELARRERVIDLRGEGHEQFVARLRALPPGRTFFYQPTMRGRVGPWACEGRADLVLLESDAAGRPADATVVDIKASRRETVGFRLQVAFYVRLLRGALAEAGLGEPEVRGAVAARDSTLGADGGWEGFDLALYDDEVERLVAAPDSDVARAARTTLGAARYHLRPACDGCPYNQLCFADTAERLDLSLVPYLTVSEKRALRAEGVGTARELAGLVRYREAGGVEYAPERADEARRVAARWPLQTRLPVLA